MSRGPAVELDRRRAEQLFAELDGRLRRRGVAASLYVVGGIAIALTINDTRRTMDIDALASDERVMEEARALAGDEGLPANWLSQAVRPWVPPPPAQALEPPAEPGLSIHVAPPRHLLAMKLVANRRQDTEDILLLVDRLGLQKASAEDFAGLLRDVYRDDGLLAQVLGVPGGQEALAAETSAIGRWVVHRVAAQLAGEA